MENENHDEEETEKKKSRGGKLLDGGVGGEIRERKKGRFRTLWKEVEM